MTKISKRILNRVEINITDDNSLPVYKFYQDWLKLIQMKEEIDIKPNVIEFDFLPGYKFHGLRMQESEEINNSPLTFNFVCDAWEKKDL